MIDNSRWLNLRKPPRWFAIVFAAFLFIVMAWVRLVVYRGSTVPIGYGVPIVLIAVLRSRRVLWALALSFCALSFTKLFLLAPPGMTPEDRLIHTAVVLVDLLLVTGVVDLLIRHQRAWQLRGNDLERINLELSAKQQELAKLNAELVHHTEQAEEQRIRLQAILDTVPVGIIIMNAANDLRLNPAARQLLKTRDEQPPALAGIFRDGVELSREQYPIYQALAGQRAEPQELTVKLASGDEICLLVSGAPIIDRNGRTIAAVAAFLDIGEQKQLQEELERRRKSAQESSDRKSRFLSAVSHDIRTPVNAISLLAEVISQSATKPEVAAEIPKLAQDLRRSAIGLVNLISDVLDLTRLDLHSGNRDDSEFELSSYLSQECSLLKPLAENKKLAYRISPPPQPVRVRCDRMGLSRVLSNLIGNAIKFTDAGEVAVAAQLHEDRQISIHVRDTGAGIPPEYLEQIFDEFFQLQRANRNGSNGSGLGLSITKRIVESMNGSLYVQSAPGQGSTFSLTLPATCVVQQTRMVESRVKFLCIGRWSREQVRAQWADDPARHAHPAKNANIETAIEIAWQKAIARPGVLLFDGPMCRLENFHAGERLELHFTRTSYKRFLGTNLSNPQLADQFGPAALANPLGLSVALESADGSLLLGRRNATLAYYPNRVHPFAGAMEPADPLDVFAEMQRELAEELSLAETDLQEFLCLGIAQDMSILQPELMFYARSFLTRSEIESKLNATEHTRLAAVIPDAAAARDFAISPELTPIGSAAILLWGRERFGSAWFDEASGAVNLGSR